MAFSYCHCSVSPCSRIFAEMILFVFSRFVSILGGVISANLRGCFIELIFNVPASERRESYGSLRFRQEIRVHINYVSLSFLRCKEGGIIPQGM